MNDPHANTEGPQSKLWQIEYENGLMVLVPLCDITSLAELEVQTELKDVLERLEHTDPPHMIVDFGHVNYFGSSMLVAMHTIWRRIRERSGQLLLCELSDVGREIVEVSRFDSVWPVFATRQEALASLAS